MTALGELGVEIENKNDKLLNLHPNVIVKERTRMTILDIAYPHDVCTYERFELKLEKYKCLQTFIERETMSCICGDTVIIGSLGTVLKSALKFTIEMRTKNEGKRFG